MGELFSMRSEKDVCNNVTKKVRNQQQHLPLLVRVRKKHWTLLHFFWASLLCLVATRNEASAQIQSTCDYRKDTFCDYKFDKECDAPSLPQCEGGDCFDCDPCLGLSYDCEACTGAGCFWCPGDAICLSSVLGPDVWNANPEISSSCRLESDWQTTCEAVGVDNVFTDPLYDSMKWIYELIRVEDVWRQGITGAGIHVRVNDDGVDAAHDEFKENFDFQNSCEVYLPKDFEVDSHGTACASLVAGNKNNGVCAVGIAPDVTLSACNGPDTLDGATEIFMVHLEVVDVISNSWGPLPCENILKEERQYSDDRLRQLACPFSSTHPESPCLICGSTFAEVLAPDCEQAITDYCSSYYELDPGACGEYLDLYVSCQFYSLSPINEEGWAKVMQEGRGGKGVIITFAGGNDYAIGVDANTDGMVNSRYTIGVGAVGKDGLHASYSTAGAAIFVAAPGGDEESISNNIVARPGTVNGCHDITVGTSFATPIVSAVAALILQANLNLGWRDVQAIVAATAQKVDFEDESWTTNGAGFSHSYKYGFGLIDATAAVALAKTWQNFDTEKQVLKDSGAIDLGIPDFTEGSTGVLAVLTITEADVQAAAGANDIAMESVVVYLDLQHASRGDLLILLTSPAGTSSILAPSKRPENTVLSSDERWKLMSLRAWGESPLGTWTLEIADQKAGLISDCIHFPWEAELDGVLYYCADFDVITDCTDPSQVSETIITATYDGRTIVDACCGCGGGQDVTTLQPMLRSWKMIAYGHTSIDNSIPVQTQVPSSQSSELEVSDNATQTLAPSTEFSEVVTQTLAPSPAVPAEFNPPVEVPSIEKSSCNYQEELCPFAFLFDRQCNNETDLCANADCFDCDPCQIYSYDCASCTQSGCLYCPGDALCLSLALGSEYWSVYGKVSSCMSANEWSNTCQNSATNIFQDPLYDSMVWLYQLINVEPVWQAGITGAGVHVRVNDDGVDATHAELVANFDTANSCVDYLPARPEDDYGTACASIIGAAANNGVCAVGVAPGATISACKIPEDYDELKAEIFLTKLEAVDISSNSYGPDTCMYTKSRDRHLQGGCPFSSANEMTPCSACANFAPPLTDDCLSAVAQYCNRFYEIDQVPCNEYMDFFVSCYYHILPDVMNEAWQRTILEGRGGKGIIYVVSAGNSYSSRENSNANGYLNSRFTMAVGAVGKDGVHASYSTTGASVFISAPGGDQESISNNIVARPGGGCHDVTTGTYFATPVVSGVVALMLEVNPDLGWRDVQGVLASTAKQVDENDASWTTNGAGFHFSNKYGFGLVDAAAAVDASRIWRRWGNEVQVTGESGPLNTPIPDEQNGQQQQIVTTMTISDPRNLTVESVVVYLDLSHQSRGDLQISLRTSGGTESILAEGGRPLNQQLSSEERWKFLTYAGWGESPSGNWTLTIVDQSPGILSECLDMDWEVASGDENVTCESLEGILDCTDASVVDQAIVTTTYEGRTALEACCACGGGTDLTTVENVLKSWNIIVYAHDPNEVATSTPSPTASSSIGAGVNSTVPPQPGAPANSNATSVPVVTISPAAPTNATAPAPVPVPVGPLKQAVVSTIPPMVTNAEFITSGTSGTTVCDDLRAIWGMRLTLGSLAISIFACSFV